MWWFRSWVWWVGIVVACAIWILPNMPFYHQWMPHWYDWGGMALVLLYLSFGLVSLGLYGVILGGLSCRSNLETRRRALKIGMMGIGLAMGLIGCYLALMEFTHSVQPAGT